MIPEVNPYNNYRGDGVATLFDYDFFIQNGSQLIVEHIDENDVVTRLEENIDYEIVVIDEEFVGYIKFPIEDSKFGILQENETLSLQLTLPFEQISEYGQSSLLDLNSIEFSLDYLTRLCQILKRQIERSIKVNEGTETTPSELLETINSNALVSTNAAAIASKKADEALESANIASAKADETLNVYQEATEDIQEKLTQGITELNKIKDETEDFKDNLIKSGMFKFNLFDTKLSDHILTGSEAKGWALQGTYVNKTDYPDFYNKCIEEFSDENTTSYIPSKAWEQPIATADTTAINGGDMVCSASSQYSATYSPYKAMDGSTTAGAWISPNSTTSGWWQVKFPYKLKITGLTFYSAHSTAYSSKDCQFFTSSEMTTPIGNPFVGSASTFIATAVEGISKDGVITDTIFLNVTSSNVTAIGMGALVIEAQKVELNVPIYKNPNGHRFYDISDKSAVDEFYQTSAMADFYGIDKENERVFLPRNKYFAIQGIAPVVGNGITIGVTDGVSNYGLYQNSTIGVSMNTNLYGLVVGSAEGSTGNSGKNIGIAKDATKSGIEANLAPDESKYLYYCVGNTQVSQAITNVTEITTSENDTIPLFTGMYFDFKPNNVSWLKAGVQQNNAGIYKTCYDTLVEIVNGVNDYGLKVINQADMQNDTNYDEYWILDQDNLTFRTPLTISSRTYESIAPVVGNGITIGVTNGTMNYGLQLNKGGTVDYLFGNSFYGTPVGSPNATETATDGGNSTVGLTSDPAKSGIEAHLIENTTAQLYFKVANAVQNLELLEAGKILESLSGKMDRVECRSYVVETYQNGDSWYRIYSDGWLEQGGKAPTTKEAVVKFLKSYKDLNYSFIAVPSGNGGNGYIWWRYTNKGVDTVTVTMVGTSSTTTSDQLTWEVKGYIA